MLKLDTVELTSTSSLIKNKATVAIVIRMATREKAIKMTIECLKMQSARCCEREKYYMQYSGREDFYEDEQGYVTSVICLLYMMTKILWLSEVHYVNINWLEDDGNDTDSDNPSHMMIVNKNTGDVEYRLLRISYSRFRDCNVRVNGIEGYAQGRELVLGSMAKCFMRITHKLH